MLLNVNEGDFIFEVCSRNWSRQGAFLVEDMVWIDGK
jgi:hypothetical protein